jgi:hypothetical protein
MKYQLITFENYLKTLPEIRKAPISSLRNCVLKNLPEGYEEHINDFGLNYVVPISTFPSGYHCSPGEPLPFISIASQKNFIAIYHMGIYANEDVLNWFTNEYPKHVKTKLDMGKSCIRFKKEENIPYELLGDLFQKISVAHWIEMYKKQFMK